MTINHSKTIKNLSSGYGYHYASLADFAKQGVKIPSMRVKPTEFGEYVEYLDDENKWQTGAKIVIPDMKGMNAAQVYGSALTYARRYTVALAQGIATDDDDALEKTKVWPSKSPNQSQQKATSPQNVRGSAINDTARKAVRDIFSDDDAVLEAQKAISQKAATPAQKAKLLGLLGEKYDAVIAKNSDKGFLSEEKAREIIAALDARKQAENEKGV